MKFGYIACEVVKITSPSNDVYAECVDLGLLDYSRLAKGDAVVNIRWFRTNKGDWCQPHFLGDIELATSADRIQIMRAAINAISENDNINDPDAIIVRWVREGKAVQVAYDPRVKKYVSVSSLESAEEKSWCITFGDVDEGEAEEEITVHAKDLEDAQTRMGQELVKRATANAKEWGGRLGTWFAEGRPVSAVVNAKLPTVHPDTVYSKRLQPRTEKVKPNPRVKKAAAE